MKTAIRLFVLFAVLSFGGCKKDPEVEDPGPLNLPQAILDYSYFQPGTYWVYIDSVSGRVDSLYVWKTRTGYDNMQLFDYPARDYQWIETSATSAMDGYDYIFYSSASYSVKDESKVPVYVTKQKIGNYVGQGLMFINPPIIGESIPYYNSSLMVLNVIPSYFLNGNQYNDVIQIYHDISAVEVSNHVTNFIAHGYGIIRKEYLDSNQVWNLARSNIIQ